MGVLRSAVGLKPKITPSRGIFAPCHRQIVARKVGATKNTTRGENYAERDGDAALRLGIRVRGFRRDRSKGLGFEGLSRRNRR